GAGAFGFGDGGSDFSFVFDSVSYGRGGFAGDRGCEDESCGGVSGSAVGDFELQGVFVQSLGQTVFDRRAFLRIGSIGVFGFLPLGDALRLRAETPAKSKNKVDPKDIAVIHFMLAGGISQMDSFDPKPDAGGKFRSIFKPIPTNVAGIQVCEHLPRSAKIA